MPVLQNTDTSPCIHQICRRLFAELQAGPRASADPTAFAQTLSLDHSVQQDGQEFTKLLLTLLERLFRESGVQVCIFQRSCPMKPLAANSATSGVAGVGTARGQRSCCSHWWSGGFAIPARVPDRKLPADAQLCSPSMSIWSRSSSTCC